MVSLVNRQQIQQMKNQKIIKIRVENATIEFWEIGQCLGGVRFMGWIDAATRTEAFKASGIMARTVFEKTQGLGAFCMEETGPNGGPVSAPFEFEMPAIWDGHAYRNREDSAAVYARELAAIAKSGKLKPVSK
jgi:hypothetical protein